MMGNRTDKALLAVVLMGFAFAEAFGAGADQATHR